MLKIEYIKTNSKVLNLQESNFPDIVDKVVVSIYEKIDEIKNLKEDINTLKGNVKLLEQEKLTLKQELIRLKKLKKKKEKISG